MSQSVDLARAQQRFARRQRLVRWRGWLPWAIIAAVVVLWTTFKVANIGQQAIH